MTPKQVEEARALLYQLEKWGALLGSLHPAKDGKAVLAGVLCIERSGYKNSVATLDQLKALHGLDEHAVAEVTRHAIVQQIYEKMASTKQQLRDLGVEIEE